MESVKERIQKLCKLRGISLHKLEVDLGFGNSTIRKWDKTQPRIDKLQAVADYFGVDVSEIAVYNIGSQNDEIKKQNDGIDDFGFAIDNYGKSLTDEQKQLLINLAKSMNTKE